MKTQYFFILSLLLSILTWSNALAQDKLPSFPGGFLAFEEFLNKNYIALQIERPASITVEFVVSEDGQISKLKLKKGFQADFDKEIMRILALMPKWNPGQSGGQKMAMMMRFPITVSKKRLVLDIAFFNPDPIITGYRANDSDLEKVFAMLGKSPASTDSVHLHVDQAPNFPGGESKLIAYLQSNSEYPRIAKENGVYGNVEVYFVVEKDGSVSNIKTIKGIGAGCEEEVISVINKMPKWAPGKINGQHVRTAQLLGVRFTL